MASGSPALAGHRRARWRQPRYAVVGAVLVAVALTVVTSTIGRELVGIQSLAADVQNVVLPQIMARQQRAIWIESLRGAASVVLYAPDRNTRHQTLAKAEQLAANVTHADAVSREALDDAWASIRLAARRADEAQQIDQQMQAMLSEADSLITDMGARLGTMVDESGTTIARMVRSPEQSPAARSVLEQAMASNAASHDLLANLDRARVILGSAPSLESEQDLTSAQARFAAIGTRLQAQADTLRGKADSAYLPDTIELFLHLEALFDQQRHKLALLQEALQASASAKLRLGVVRETLAADAAAAAETSVATIAASANRIKLAAAAMVAILIIAAAVPLTRGWLAGRAAAGTQADATSARAAEDGSTPDAASARAMVGSLESLIKAQGNLAHWRMTLVAKLTGAVTSALHRVAERTPDAAADPSAAPPGQTTTGDATAATILPPDIAPCLTRMVELIEDIAAQTGLLGLRASLEEVRLIGGADADVGQTGRQDPFAPSDALAVAASVAEAATERVGATISDINAVAQRADGDLARARADVIRMVAQLADQLRAIRDDHCQRPSYAA